MRASLDDGGLVRRVLESASRIAIQSGLQAGGELCAERIEDLVGADRASVLVFDADAGTLRSTTAGGRPRAEPLAGLAGEAATGRRSVVCERVGEDPRHVRRIDDPGGSPRDRLLAVPVHGPEERVLAVLVAVRRPSRPPFGRDEQNALELLARLTASWFTREQLRERLDAAAEERREAARGAETSIFREAALTAHSRGGEGEGLPLRMSPRWSRWAPRLLYLAAIAGGLVAWFGSVSEWVSGPAVVRIEGYRQVAAEVGGEVAAIEVDPGERVRKGELLLRFATGLRSAGTPRAGELRAAADGLVTSVWITPGEIAAPGDPLLAVQPAGGRASAIVLLPGRSLDRLRPGLPVEVELRGFGRLRQPYRLATVADAAIDRRQARRYLGDPGGDLGPASPLVVASVDLGAPAFRAQETDFPFQHGMEGTVRVKLGTQRILFALFPNLRTVLDG